MKKVFVLLFCIITLTSCFSEDKAIVKDKVVVKKIEEKFWVLTKYIKADITDIESKNLENILEERKEKLVEIKGMIEKSSKETKDETYEKIIEIRKWIFDKISIYVPEEKIQTYKRYNEKINFMIKNQLDNK